MTTTATRPVMQAAVIVRREPVNSGILIAPTYLTDDRGAFREFTGHFGVYAGVGQLPVGVLCANCARHIAQWLADRGGDWAAKHLTPKQQHLIRQVVEMHECPTGPCFEPAANFRARSYS